MYKAKISKIVGNPTRLAIYEATHADTRAAIMANIDLDMCIEVEASTRLVTSSAAHSAMQLALCHTMNDD